jgi:hypothetical protein
MLAIFGKDGEYGVHEFQDLTIFRMCGVHLPFYSTLYIWYRGSSVWQLLIYACTIVACTVHLKYKPLLRS